MTTSPYIVDRGYTIPNFFPDFTLQFLRKERRTFHLRLTGTYVPAETILRYQGYIAWMDIREKELQLLELIGATS